MWENATKADQEAYSHEVISAGFWSGDQNVRGAAYYSYTYPSPEGIDQEALKPEAANWQDANGSPMAMLMLTRPTCTKCRNWCCKCRPT